MTALPVNGDSPGAEAAKAGPAVNPGRPVAAFFDVDNTLIRGASIYHFARGLAARSLLGPRDVAQMTIRHLSFQLHRAEDLSQVDAARQAALAFVAGRNVADLVQLGEEIYNETMASRIWDGTRELTQRHLDAGEQVWLVTATPVELAEILARELGLTGALGTVAEIEDGKYTGRLVGGLLHGEAKAAAIRALAELEGLDLARCTAYSDSANDLPMLTLVGHPNAVNPDRRLRAEAARHDWPVHEFRTGRRAKVIVLLAAAGAGALAGGTATGLAMRRRRVSA
jgi:HAD superfamily hydrolase (TIGR01490 family)